MMTSVLPVAIAAVLGASPALAHMTLASPVPFGDPTTSPLSSDGSNYPCQIVGSASSFYTSSSTSSNNTMAVGATQTLSFHGSAVHGGGSCQLALTTDLQPSASTSWEVFLSIEGGCPTTDGTGPSTYDYTIPDSFAAGQYVFAWTWISKLSGAPEYYMNCAPVTITAGSAKRDVELDKRDTNSTSSTSSSSSALPNLFVANLASINSCKTTTSTDPLYPDPGPNVLKPSKMTTNYQSPSGTDCFPLGASNSTTSSGGSGSGSSSSSTAAAAASPSANSGSGSGSGGASSAKTSSTAAAAAPATTLTTSTTTANTTAAAATAATTQTSGGVFVTVSTSTGAAASGAGTTAAAATTSAAAAASTTAAATAATATTSAASSNTTTTTSSSSSGLSGACTDEGMFNCVGGSEYQQCASGAWTALQAMPAGTTCQLGQSTTLWARRDAGSSASKRFRRVRKM